MNRVLYITEIVLCGLQIVETYIFKEKMNYYKIEFDNEYQQLYYDNCVYRLIGQKVCVKTLITLDIY